MANGPPKKRFGEKPGFNPARLSPTNKPIATTATLDHLADEIKHATDVRIARDLREKYVLKSLGIEEPELLIGAAGTGDTFGENVAGERDVENAINNRGVIACVFNNDLERLDGQREWLEYDGYNWIESMKIERRKRRSFRYENHSKMVDREDLALDCIYLRLPPWIAIVMRKKMIAQREDLVAAMSKIGAEFQKRYGVDTLGVAVHSEADHDLHLHVVFSQCQRIPKEKFRHKVKDRRRLWRTLNDSVRTELKLANRPCGNRAVHQEVATRIEKGVVEDPDEIENIFEYRRRREEKTIKEEWESGEGSVAPILIRGPAYRSKYWVWEAASEDRKEEVIRRGERVDWEGGFRQFLRDASGGQTAAEEWTDIWCEQTWRDLILQHATPEERDEIRAIGEKMVDQYIRVGSTIPSRIEIVADALVSTRKELGQTKEARDQAEKNLIKFQSRAAEDHGRLRNLEDRLKRQEETLIKLRETEQARDRAEKCVIELETQSSGNDRKIRELEARLKLRDEEASMIGGIVGMDDYDVDLPDAVARVRDERDYHKGMVVELMEKMNAVAEVLASLLPRALREQLAKVLPNIFSQESLGLNASPPRQSPVNDTKIE